MSLPLYQTLEELRNQVLIRCGYSTAGNQSAAVTPLVDSLIAGAERELYHEMTWLQAQARASIALTAGSGVVDWPDDCEPGEIANMWVVRTATGEISELVPGVMVNERNSADNGESGRPLLYEYMDRQIYLKPAPSTDYGSLVVTYNLAPRLVQATDRCVVDPELLIQRAVFKFKEYNGLPVGQVEMANHERYLARLRASNSDNAGFVMGGSKSWRTDVQRRNRIAKNNRIGAGAEYTTGWNPW